MNIEMLMRMYSTQKTCQFHMTEVVFTEEIFDMMVWIIIWTWKSRAGYVDNSGPAGLYLSRWLIIIWMLTEPPLILLTEFLKTFNLTFKRPWRTLLATVMHSNCKFKSTSPESKSKAMLVEEYSEENKQIVRPLIWLKAVPRVMLPVITSVWVSIPHM